MNDPSLFDDIEFTECALDAISRIGYDEVARIVRSLVPTVEAGSAPARWSDPETSHKAAKKEQDVGRFTPRSSKARLLGVFAGGDYTDQQATARVVGRNAAISAFEGTRRRCSDLHQVNFVYDTGKRRKNAGSDDEAIVWGISQEGREALDRLDATGWSR
jgi:hypothetical protein